MATTVEKLKSVIRKEAFARAARDVGIDPDFADAAQREYVSLLQVDDEGNVRIAGYADAEDLIRNRVKADRPRYFEPPKRSENAPTPGELARMLPGEKMRYATMVAKPKGY